MSNVNTTDVGSGYNSVQINANFVKLKNGINEQVLHRQGANNSMNQELDMNGYPIYNIGVDLQNPSSAVTQAQFQDIIADLEAQIRESTAFLIDGDVIIGEGVNLGTAAFEDIQTGYYLPGTFDTGEKHVLVNGSFGLGSELSSAGAYTGNLNSIDPATGISTTQFRYCTNAATNLPIDGSPGYVINVMKDQSKSAQLFISEAGEGVNEEAWDLSTNSELGQETTANPYRLWLATLLHPEGEKYYVAANSTVDDDRIYTYSLDTPFDPTSVTGYTSAVHVEDLTDVSQLAYMDDGNRAIAVKSNGSFITYTLSTPYDFEARSVDQSGSVIVGFSALSSSSIQSCQVSPDGLTAVILDSNSSSSRLHQLSMSSAFDFSTLAFVKSNTNTLGTNMRDLHISDEGESALIVDKTFGTSYDVKTLTFASAWDIASWSFTGDSLSVIGQVGGDTPRVSVTPDGGYFMAGEKVTVEGSPARVTMWSMGSGGAIEPGIFYRTKDGNDWEVWKRLLTNLDPANVKSTFTVGGEIDIPIVAGVATLDCSLGNSFNLVVTEDVFFTFANEPEVGDDYTCKIKITDGGSHLFDLDSDIKVAGGVVPGLTDGGVDIVVLTFNGTDIYGAIPIVDAQ